MLYNAIKKDCKKSRNLRETLKDKVNTFLML